MDVGADGTQTSTHGMLTQSFWYLSKYIAGLLLGDCSVVLSDHPADFCHDSTSLKSQQ